jgi:hypothetical protein
MNTRNLAKVFRLSASARILAALVLILTGSIIATGQQITGSIVGTVKDQQGALITTATVKAINVDTGFSRSAPVNGYGEYRIDYLPVGRYTVEAVAAGFERYVHQNLALNVDQTLTVDALLTVGSQSQTITVTEAPPVVNTTDAVLGRTIEPAEIIGLPLVNRNVYSELSLVPGVMANNQSPTSNPTGSPQMTVGIASTAVQVNGSLDSGNGTVAFYLDGGNNITGMRNYGNPAPNPDAIEEFRVETSAFSAQYGQFSAAVVSVITKSGTNKFHGSLFEFNRNTDFNAYNWTPIKNPFVPGALLKAPYHRNQFGGTFGGPIKHDKAFFFFSYAGLRMVQGSPVTGGVTPTAAERLGDFTADINLAGSSYVYMPGTAKTVPANGANAGPGCQAANLSPAGTPAGTGTSGFCLPTASIDKVAANFLNVSNTIGVSVPLPTGAQVAKTGGGAYVGMYVQPTDEDEYLGKFDENIGSKDHVGVTYFYANTATTPSGGGNINWTGNQSKSVQTNANISDVHTFSASTANQAWLTFTRAMGGRVLIPVTGPANQTLASFGSNFLIQGPAGLPYLTGAGFQTGNPNAGPVTGSDNYELRDVVTITKGKHNLSLGGEYALEKTMFAANLNNYGDLTFSTSAPTSTGVTIADFLTGQLSAFEQDSTYITHLSTWHYAVFAQDNYRITPRFTANLGIRWDIDTPPVDSHNRTASFVPGVQSTVVTSTTSVVPKGLLFPGDTGIGRGIISTQLGHISPRLGIAWDPFGDGKTAVRAAAGIFYGLPSGNEWNQPGNAMPFSIRNGFGNETSMTNIYHVGFPVLDVPGGGIFPYTYTPSAPKFYPSQSIEAIPTSFKDSSVYQFNLSVQRQLPARISVTAAYVGTLGRHLSSFLDANYAPFSTVANGGTPLVNTPTPCSSNVGGTAGTVAGLCNSAQSQEQRRQWDSGQNLAPGTLSGITYLISDQTSNYNGLQISATKAMSHGFTISGFYVWSRALESSNPVENGGMNMQNPGVLGKPFTVANDHGMLDQNGAPIVGGGLQEERGLMDQNHDNNAALSGMWNIDYYRGSNKIVKGFVNGWTISPVIYLISGGPFSMSTGSNKNFDTAGQSRPNAVPGVSPKLNPHRCRVCASGGVMQAWYNTAAFTPNGPGQPGGIGPGGADGNVGRDSLNGPGLKDMDAGLLRDIKLYRSTTFQFRAEVTNVMNWVNLGQPNGSLSAGSAEGTITGAVGTQRIIQLGGRLTF